MGGEGGGHTRHRSGLAGAKCQSVEDEYVFGKLQLVQYGLSGKGLKERKRKRKTWPVQGEADPGFNPGASTYVSAVWVTLGKPYASESQFRYL